MYLRLTEPKLFASKALLQQREIANLRPSFEENLAAAILEREAFACELETLVSAHKRSLDNIRATSNFWEKQFNETQQKLIAAKAELQTTKSTLASTEEHLESARNAHTLTKRAHAETTHQLHCSVSSNAACYEQLQSAHSINHHLHNELNIAKEKHAHAQNDITAALKQNETLQQELDDERIEHETAKQTHQLITEDLTNNHDLTRMKLARLQAEIALAQKTPDATSDTADPARPASAHSVTANDALIYRLRSRVRTTSAEIATVKDEVATIKTSLNEMTQARDRLQCFKDNLACDKTEECIKCPHHMRKHIHICRAAEVQANELIDSTSFECAKLGSELQDLQMVVSRALGENVREWLIRVEKASERSSSAAAGELAILDREGTPSSSSTAMDEHERSSSSAARELAILDGKGTLSSPSSSSSNPIEESERSPSAASGELAIPDREATPSSSSTAVEDSGEGSDSGTESDVSVIIITGDELPEPAPEPEKDEKDEKDNGDDSVSDTESDFSVVIITGDEPKPEPEKETEKRRRRNRSRRSPTASVSCR